MSESSKVTIEITECILHMGHVLTNEGLDQT